jgi:hypothetical protein
VQPLDSTSWAGIIPIIEELPPVRDRRGVPSIQSLTRQTVRGPRICSTNAALSGDPVLVDQATEPVGSLEPVGAGELP